MSGVRPARRWAAFIAALGIAVPFWIFAASNVVIVAALVWWRKPQKAAESLPAERLVSAVRAGIRHVANNQYLRAALMRVLAFFPFASAYLALLPLLARDQISGGPQVYGILLGAIGVGAVGGSLALRWLKDELGPDRLVAAGSIVAAFALVLFGLANEPIVAICACFLAGASWTVVITKLYVSAQIALPDWARGRGLAVFLSFIFGATTVGSVVWGKLSAMAGLPIAYFVAAAGVVLGVPLAWRWKLQAGVGIDFSPAAHWRAPIATRKVENNQGPVLAVVEYRVEAANRAEFLGAIDELGHARRRDGAYAWGVYEDVADVGRFVETFSVNSWLELMHQRERVINTDEMLANRVRHLLRRRLASHSVCPRSALTGLGEATALQRSGASELCCGQSGKLVDKKWPPASPSFSDRVAVARRLPPRPPPRSAVSAWRRHQTAAAARK